MSAAWSNRTKFIKRFKALKMVNYNTNFNDVFGVY